MVYEPTVTDEQGHPIAGVFIQATNLRTYHTSSRSTDGGGYANVALPTQTGDHVSLLVLDPELRYKGYAHGDVPAADHHGPAKVVLSPFVGSVVPVPPIPPQPPQPQPPSVGDEMAFDQAVQHRGPAFTGWPVTTAITHLELTPNGVHIAFSKKDGPGRWPDITPPGWNGPLQYCLGIAMRIDGVWHVSAPIQFWHGLDASGGNVGDPSPRPNGIAGTIYGDWFYSAEWGPMQRQPAAGEMVGFFVIAGNVRGVDDVVSVQERSNVIVVPFPDVLGASFSRP